MYIFLYIHLIFFLFIFYYFIHCLTAADDSSNKRPKLWIINKLCWKKRILICALIIAFGSQLTRFSYLWIFNIKTLNFIFVIILTKRIYSIISRQKEDIISSFILAFFCFTIEYLINSCKWMSLSVTPISTWFLYICLTINLLNHSTKIRFLL